MILTWTCHVCGEERPDEAISVLSKSVPGDTIGMTQNIRYCNDRTSCTLAAPDKNLVDMRPKDER